MHSQPKSLSRRRFLAAGALAGGVALLGACGSDDSDDASTDDGADTGSDGARGYGLIPFLRRDLAVLSAEARSRVPFALADKDGLLPTDQVPKSLQVRIRDTTNGRSTNSVSVARHGDGLARAYFALEVTFDKPGIYTIESEFDGEPIELSVQAYPDDQVTVVRPGVRMPPLETPTMADAKGVDPICTRDPVCPLHDITVAQATQNGKPLALLVATPAFCQVAICGPVLEILLDVMADHPGVQYLHAEVYTQPKVNLDTFTPAVTQLALPQEPVLVLVGSDGVVTERLDVIFDRVELDAKLGTLSGV